MTEDEHKIPTRDEAFEFYMGKREKMTPKEKALFNKFEGRRMFRYGTEWRRTAANTDHVLVIPDGMDAVLITYDDHVMHRF